MLDGMLYVLLIAVLLVTARWTLLFLVQALVRLVQVLVSLAGTVSDVAQAERQADEILTLPLHEYLTTSDLDYMAAQIRAFYQGS